MDPQLYGLIEPLVVIGTLFGIAVGVKLLVWGKGPIRRLRGRSDQSAVEHRVAELEDRWEQMAELAERQVSQLEDLHERLDFAERMLTQRRAKDPRVLEEPEVSTPV